MRFNMGPNVLPARIRATISIHPSLAPPLLGSPSFFAELFVVGGLLGSLAGIQDGPHLRFRFFHLELSKKAE